MKKKLLLSSFLFLSFVMGAAPLYDEETLPSSGEILGQGIPVVFTVPTEVELAFSSDSDLIIDPGTTVLDIESEVEDGSFYITHDDLYALWNIKRADSSSFKVYLYLTGPLEGNSTGQEINWTVAGGHSIIGGGDGKYCQKYSDINNLNSVELASGRVKSFEKLTIDIVNIDNLIKTNKIEDDTYEGTICLYYKDN